MDSRILSRIWRSQFLSTSLVITADQIETTEITHFRDKDFYWYVIYKVTNKNRKQKLMNTKILFNDAYYAKVRNHPLMAIYKVLRKNSPLIKKHKKMTEQQIIKYLEDDFKYKTAWSTGKVTRGFSLNSEIGTHWVKDQYIPIGDLKPKESKYILFKTRGIGEYVRVQGDTKA